MVSRLLLNKNHPHPEAPYAPISIGANGLEGSSAGAAPAAHPSRRFFRFLMKTKKSIRIRMVFAEGTP